jgi:predicted house-cleaning NTP pyrophosphatase (Maf/HAM1 superfamily)
VHLRGAKEMKEHYCLVEKSRIGYENKCNWCGQKLSDNEIADLLEAVNKETGVRHIRTFDHTKILLKKLQELQQWQYLTDDEIKEIIGSYGDGVGGYTRELFDKIEAKIREKNV